MDKRVAHGLSDMYDKSRLGNSRSAISSDYVSKEIENLRDGAISFSRV